MRRQLETVFSEMEWNYQEMRNIAVSSRQLTMLLIRRTEQSQRQQQSIRAEWFGLGEGFAAVHQACDSAPCASLSRLISVWTH